MKKQEPCKQRKQMRSTDPISKQCKCPFKIYFSCPDTCFWVTVKNHYCFHWSNKKSDPSKISHYWRHHLICSSWQWLWHPPVTGSEEEHGNISTEKYNRLALLPGIRIKGLVLGIRKINLNKDKVNFQK